METNLKFNSAICTSREQSERLLALGLKKETADMAHVALQRWDGNDYENTDKCEILVLDEELAEYYNRVFDTDDLDTYCSAWSLHRLIELAEVSVEVSGIWVRINGAYRYEEKDNAYDNLIDVIADLINNDVFNTEYLEE